MKHSPLATRKTEAALMELQAEAEAARRLASEARAPATLRAYDSDVRRFQAWCESRKVIPRPADPRIVALYVAHLAQLGKAPATITRKLVSISQWHRRAGHESPTSGPAREVLRGYQRQRGSAQKQAKPLTADVLRRIVSAMNGDGLVHKRDRAVLLLGFAGAFRRSELAGLDVADLERTEDGMIVTLRRSKTDQTGAGVKVGIPFASVPELCPVRSVFAWLDAATIKAGPVFRSVNRWKGVSDRAITPHSVGQIVKRATELCGYDPRDFSGHSLRAGFVTSAAKAGKPEYQIAKQTRHRSFVVLRRYIRDADILGSNNAARGLL